MFSLHSVTSKVSLSTVVVATLVFIHGLSTFHDTTLRISLATVLSATAIYGGLVKIQRVRANSLHQRSPSWYQKVMRLSLFLNTVAIAYVIACLIHWKGISFTLHEQRERVLIVGIVGIVILGAVAPLTIGFLRFRSAITLGAVVAVILVGSVLIADLCTRPEDLYVLEEKDTLGFILLFGGLLRLEMEVPSE